MERRSKRGKCPDWVLAGACEGSACGACPDAILAFAMMLAVPFVWADVVLANNVVNDLVCLKEKQWNVVNGYGEEEEECSSVDGGPGHGCQKN